MQPEASQEATSPAAEASQDAASPAAAAEQVEFRVVLRGVKLDPSIEKALCQEIRIAILQELSHIGHDGDLRVTSFGEQPQARPLLSKASRLVGMVVTGAAGS